MKKSTKLLALMLVVSMLFSSLGVFVSADEKTSEVVSAELEKTATQNTEEALPEEEKTKEYLGTPTEEDIEKILRQEAENSEKQAQEQSKPLDNQTKAEGVGYYYITNDKLNVRWGPSTSYGIFGYVSAGDCYYVYETSGDWGRIGESIWINLNYAVSTNSKRYRISTTGVDFIKKYEGYSQFKYWDYSQWTIGYGCACGENDYPNGITEPEAAELLRKVIIKYELYLDAFLTKYDITVNQRQYDALVSVTYNAGNIWVVDGKGEPLKGILLRGIDNFTEADVKWAFTNSCVTAGGSFLQGLYNRRVGEANLFMSGWGCYYYDDVNTGDWYNECVGYATRLCYMSGVGNSNFAPNDLLTREQLIRIMYSYSGKSGYDGMTVYSDVDSSEWYAPAIHWATESGITSGIGNGLFGVGMPVTREMLVTVMYNFSKYLGVDTTVYAYFDAYYNDADMISPWAYEAINWALEREVILGTASYTLSAQGYATRASAAKVFSNYDKFVLGLYL